MRSTWRGKRSISDADITLNLEREFVSDNIVNAFYTSILVDTVGALYQITLPADGVASA